MKKKIYFAGSIRGGQSDTQLYHEMIEYIKETDTVLTEQVGDINRPVTENPFDAEKLIYDKDMAWLEECDMVIAECTVPSLGVGYELAYAEAHHKPVYVLYRPEKTNLSALIRGNSFFTICPYSGKEEALDIIHRILTAEI